MITMIIMITVMIMNEYVVDLKRICDSVTRYTLGIKFSDPDTSIINL